MEPVFHLSLSVSDLAQTRRFYEQVLEAKVGRVTDHWLDLWIFGTQLTAYARPAGVVPSPYREAQHFGATLGWDQWRAFADRLDETGAVFRLPPTVDVAKGTAKMMLADPDGYLIEIKAYADPTTLQRPAV